nr:RNA-directed DNA polymerase, eukaryota [Tanacetum cinerariifolium]
MGSKDLWQTCNKHGTVADVYIARKLSKIRRRVAFVRFLKVTNTGSLIDDLNKIWIRTYHLFVAMARFERKLKDSPKPVPKPTSTHSHNQPKPASHSSHANPNRSYVTTLNGKSSQNHVPKETIILKSVTLDVSDLIETCDMRNVILIKVRDVHLILNINNVLRKEGFYDFQSKYIGGMWLWIEFDSIESCKKLQSNKEMSWYFTQMKHVTQSFKVDERVAWIEIGGLPLNVWTSKAYKKIACNWGEPLFVDEDPQDNVAMGRVCIRMKIQGQIIETWKLVIHGQSHNVRVKEFAGWVPDIEAMDSLSFKNSDMGISENHDDVNSDNGAQDAEEGKIRETNEFNEEKVVNRHLFSWADDEVNISKDHDDSSPRNQPKESQKKIPTETSEALKGESETISKPPGFENFKPKKLQNTHQTSSSFPGTKSSRANPFKVKCLWGNFQFDYAVSPSSSRSGGLVSVWDSNTFTKLNVFPSENLLIVEDFNVVRFALERIGTIFNSASGNVFNQFISDSHLLEIPHGGHLFTRINSRGDKLSKLDRFLITENSTSHMHNYSSQVLDCYISDHRLIVLSASSLDFSPTPFKLYNSWLLDKHLHTIFTDFWEQHVVVFGSNSIVGFKNKTKTLKTIIKEWSRNRIPSQAREKEDLIKKLKKFDAATVRGFGNIMADFQRSTWIENLLPEAEIRNAIWDCGSEKSSGPDDDALFIGEWSRANHKSMASIPECFHRVFGLKITFHKSNLAGVGVLFEEINYFSQITGCNAMQSSFLYLGLLVDCDMANTKSWDPILDKFSKCLSKWKSSLLSIGGITTLLSFVLGAIVKLMAKRLCGSLGD